jgi:hypothetical protein
LQAEAPSSTVMAINERGFYTTRIRHVAGIAGMRENFRN